MRVALILSLIIAIAAAVFAMQNPNETSLNIGPYVITASTALVIIVTFVLGVLVGILASLPGRMRHRKKVKEFERRTPREAGVDDITHYDPLATPPRRTTNL